MKNKKLIIISIISSLLVGLIVYILFNPHYYTLEVTTGSSYNYASGVLTNNMFKGSFFLNVNLDEKYSCLIGIINHAVTNNARLSEMKQNLQLMYEIK